jgi:lipoprotein-anchoring transpeptidase ErfK/SrfK
VTDVVTTPRADGPSDDDSVAPTDEAKTGIEATESDDSVGITDAAAAPTPVDEETTEAEAEDGEEADSEPTEALTAAGEPEDEASVDESFEGETAEADPTTLSPTVAVPVADDSATTEATAPVYAWAPAEPKPKKKRAAIWLSAAAGVAVVGLVVSSLVLIAPGTAVAGVPVGWMTPGAAADAIDRQLAVTTVVLTGEGGDVEITGAELGAAVDARALADAAFEKHPMWNPTAWFAATGAEVEVDPVAASEALRELAPQLYTDPVDAEVTFDAATASYVTTAAVPGTGIDVATVEDAIQAAFEAGETRVELDPVESEVPATISTEAADETVAKLNGMLDTAGFYVGDERTVPVDRAVAASWLTVTPDEDGFAITADAEAIQPVVDTLPGVINRAPENAIEITDTAGKVLKEIAAGQSGRQLGDTSSVAGDFAAQLATGDAVYKLAVDEVPVTTTTLARNIVVDLSEQRAYFYENGVVVKTTLVSSGMDGHLTETGNFRIRTKLVSQNMGNPDTTQWPYYYTKDVPWVMYFNGDQALHGAYWHNDFGRRRSHGCVNFPMGVAQFAYEWAPMGTEVRVQS